MHLEFFSLKRPPFDSSPDPAFYHLTEAAQNAAAHLGAELARSASLLFLAGRTGSGKSALLQCLAANHFDQRRWGIVDRPRPDSLSLQATVRDTLAEIALHCQTSVAHARKPPVIAIDHVEEQEQAALRDLLLRRVESRDREDAFRLLLVGVEPLALCRSIASEHLADEVLVEVALQPIGSTDAKALIHHRLHRAGYQGPPLFTADAEERIHVLSGGFPGDILQLADSGLYFAAHQGLAAVTAPYIDKAASYVLVDTPRAEPAPTAAETEHLPSRQPSLLAARGLALFFLILFGTGAAWILFRGLPNETSSPAIETSRPPPSLAKADEVEGDRPEAAPLTANHSPVFPPLPAEQPTQAHAEPENDIAGLIAKKSSDLSRYLVDGQVSEQPQQSSRDRSAAPPGEEASKPVASAVKGEKKGFKPTDLEQAIIAGDRGEVQRLLRTGVPLDKTNAIGDTALMKAVWLGRGDMVDDLLPFAPPVNQRNKDGCTALYFAAVKGQTAIAAALLAHGARVDQADLDGRTPLMAATWNGHTQIVHLLLRHKAETNHTSRDGWTPLMFAALGGHLDIGKALISHGADPFAANKEGLDSRHLASTKGHAAFLAILPRE